MQREAKPDAGHGSAASYTVGFLLSVALTVLAYIFVVNETFSREMIIAAILGLAVVQFAVQLIFFLHLGRESRPRWNFILLLFMLLVLVIVVFGSIWIMDNLNYNMMPEEAEKHIIEDEGYSEHHEHHKH